MAFRFWCIAVAGLFLGQAFGQEDVVLYLLGRVVMEDGSKVPKDFAVQLVCEGKKVRQVSCSEQGVFSFDLGSWRSKDGTSDASTSTKIGGLDGGFARDAWNPSGFNTVLGRVYLDDCTIRLMDNPSYRASEIKLGIRGLMDDPDVGELLVRKARVGEATTLTVRVPTDPPEVLKLISEGRAELAKEKPDPSRAAKKAEQALKISDSSADALMLLGEARVAQRKENEGRKVFQQLANSDPNAVAPRLALAQLDIESQQWDSALIWANEVLGLEPDSTKGLLYLGLASYYTDQLNEAYQALSTLEKNGLAEKFSVAVLHLGMLYARRGFVEDAAERFRRYLEIASPAELTEERREAIEKQLTLWDQQR